MHATPHIPMASDQHPNGAHTCHAQERHISTDKQWQPSTIIIFIAIMMMMMVVVMMITVSTRK
jgi:hypothetical protein